MSEKHRFWLKEDKVVILKIFIEFQMFLTNQID